MIRPAERLLKGPGLVGGGPEGRQEAQAGEDDEDGEIWFWCRPQSHGGNHSWFQGVAEGEEPPADKLKGHHSNNNDESFD